MVVLIRTTNLIGHSYFVTVLSVSWNYNQKKFDVDYHYNIDWVPGIVMMGSIKQGRAYQYFIEGCFQNFGPPLYNSLSFICRCLCSQNRHRRMGLVLFWRYTRKNAQVVTSLQTSCNKSVHKLSTSCVRTVSP